MARHSPSKAHRPEWVTQLREERGPGVCLFCKVLLVKKRGRPAETCGSEACRREYKRGYDTAGEAYRESETLQELRIDVRMMVRRCEEVVSASRVLRQQVAAALHLSA